MCCISPIDRFVKMDNGKSFGQKTISRAPIDHIQVRKRICGLDLMTCLAENSTGDASQLEKSWRWYPLGGKVKRVSVLSQNSHFCGSRYDRITSQIIPGTLLVIAAPLIGYGLYVISTQPAPNS